MWPAILSVLGPIVGKVIDKIPNKEERELARLSLEKELAEQETKLLEIVISSANKQSDVNAVEAANSNVFVSGWRPALGWVCGAGMSWVFVIQPLATWICAAVGHPVNLPDLNSGNLMELVLGMLGLGGLRTFEKVKGVAR
jgi:hypothetical protein